MASSARIIRLGTTIAPSPDGAVVNNTTARSWRAARSRTSAIAAWRSGQRRAAAQPSSTTRISGPSPSRRVSGLSSGRARPTIRSAASASRRAISQGGVLAGVSSVPNSPNNSHTGGKRTSLGAGGMAFRSHQMSGRTTSAASTHGAAKTRLPNPATGPTA